MKKMSCMFLALVLVLALGACGGRGTNEKEPARPDIGSVTPTAGEMEKEGQNPPDSAALVETEKPYESSIPNAEPAPAAEQVSDDQKTEDQRNAERIVSMAYELIGREFESGGSGPETFDNSGFVYYICRENGIEIPRRSSEMADYGVGVGWDDLCPGDICVMANEIDGPAGFVGIYVGDMQFIACNKPGTVVTLQNLDVSYWRDRFISGRRVA